MSKKDDRPLKPVTFNWAPDAHGRYEIQGPKATFIANGTEQYRPFVSETTFQPGTGKHFYEIAVNCDNMRIGLAVPDADLNAEMGVGKGLYSLNLQTGACVHQGTELKRLWRLITPVSGGIFSFCWDSDAGILQAWFNSEFIGTPFNKDFNLQGKAVRPIGGIAGIEANNRDIGVGMKSMVVLKPERVPKPVLS